MSLISEQDKLKLNAIPVAREQVIPHCEAYDRATEEKEQKKQLKLAQRKIGTILTSKPYKLGKERSARVSAITIFDRQSFETIDGICFY